MRHLKSLAAAALVAGTFVAASTPAQAVITTDFANFNKLVSGSNIYWKNSGPGNTGTGGEIYTIASNSSTVPGTTIVSFNFLDGILPQGVRAKFTLYGKVNTGTPAVLIGGFLNQGGIFGNFSFIADCNCMAGKQTFAWGDVFDGDNLLTSFNYTGAVVAGQVAATSAGFAGSEPGPNASTLQFASDFMSFNNSIARDFSMTLGALSPAFGANPNKALKTFKASTNGTFGNATIPEPATWALFVVGFGFVGLQARRRRMPTSVAA